LRDSVFRLIVNVNTNVSISTGWAKNTWESILEVIKGTPVKNLFGKFKDKPAIVVSGGPSLDKDIDKIPWAKGKAVLIGLGTTFRPLVKKGIIPDLVVAVDAGAHHIKYFEGIEEDKSYLVADPMVCPQVLREFRGGKFIASVVGEYYNPSLGWMEKHLGEVGFLHGAFSVATVAFELAKLMECNPIILLGQDLSFPTGASHARGTAFCQEIDLNRPDLIKVPSNDGGEVFTDVGFLSTIRQFEGQVSGFSGVCINTAFAGAKIKGCKLMSLGEALAEYCQEKFSPARDLKDLSKEVSLKRQKIRVMIDDLREIIKMIKMLEKRSKKGLELAKQLYLLLQPDVTVGATNISPVITGLTNQTPRLEINRLMPHLQQVVDRIKSKERTFDFLNPWLYETFVYLYKTQEQDHEGVSSAIKEVNRAGVLCEGTNTACKIAIPLMEKALEELATYERGMREEVIGNR